MTKTCWLAVAFFAISIEVTRSQEQIPTPAGKPDRHISALGGLENEDRLRKVIHDTVAPPPKKSKVSAPPDTLLRWSDPVRGLASRIEYVGADYLGALVLLVRLKNVSDKPLIVPMGNPPSAGASAPFQLYGGSVAGAWTQLPFRPAPPPASPPGKVQRARKSPQPSVTLKPEESCLVELSGFDDRPDQKGAIKNFAELVVKLNVTTKDGTRWAGSMQTPPSPARAREDSLDKLTASLPCPEYLPELNAERRQLMNGSGQEADVVLLRVSNMVLLRALQFYDPAGVRREFEKRMIAEEDRPLKLLIAAIAASAGSERAALFLVESLKSTVYDDVVNAHAALRYVIGNWEADPPDWIVELIQAALRDERYVDFTKARIKRGGEPVKISYLADESSELTYALGLSKSRKAVPFLIEMVRRTGGARNPVMALGMTEDPRALPVLIECLRRAGATATYTEGVGLPDEFSAAIDGLTNMRAKEAVPVLLQYIEFPEVIEALEMIGDTRALPAIRKVIAANGKSVRNGEAQTPFLDKERLFMARVAEASLSGDAVPRLCEMVGDLSLTEDQRRTAVWRLGDRRDPRAIPVLIRAIKNDPSGAVVNQTISVLAVFKYKAAVEGLIDCFDADFKGKKDWKRAFEPEMFRENISESLREITAQSMGPNKKQWEAWWRENKQASALK